MTISIAGTALSIADLPDLDIELRKGETAYRVTVTQDAAFASAIITACTIGATVVIAVDGISFSGTVTGFGCRTGSSTLQITGATVSH
jgi:hypothetical protein